MRARAWYAPHVLTLVPHTFRTGETLDPVRVRQNLQRLERMRDDMAARRYTYSSVALTWRDVDQADGDGERERRLVTPTGSLEIVGIEVTLYGSAEDFTLTWSGNVPTNGETLTVTGAGTTERVRAYFDVGLRVSGPTSYSLEVDSDAGSWSIAHLEVRLHLRHDRWQGAPSRTFVPPAIIDGATCDRDELNTALVALAADITASDATHSIRLEQIDVLRNLAAAPSAAQGTIHIPSRGDTLRRFGLGGVADWGTWIQAVLKDESGSTVDTRTIAGGSTTTYKHTITTLNETQTRDDPDDSSDDYTVVVTRSVGSGTLYAVQLLLEWG